MYSIVFKYYSKISRAISNHRRLEQVKLFHKFQVGKSRKLYFGCETYSHTCYACIRMYVCVCLSRNMS